MIYNTDSENISQAWKNILKELKGKVDDNIFDSCFKTLSPRYITENKLCLTASASYHREWVLEESQSIPLEEAIKKVLGVKMSLSIVSTEQLMLPGVHPKECMAPNTLIRSALFRVVGRRRREFFKRKELDSWKGSSVRYTGEELDQNDLDVLLLILRLTRKSELGQRVQFSGYGFLKELGWGTSKRDYERLSDTLIRLKANAVEVQQGPYTYAGSLIDKYYRDDDTRRFVVIVNPDLGGLFELGFTRVQWEERMGLKTSLSKDLHFYIHSHKTTPENPHRIYVKRIRALCGSSEKRLSNFRLNLRKTMAEMESLGVVTSWQITPKTDDGGDVLEFVRPTSQKGLR